MKILFISHNFFPTIGGIEVNSQILATAFSEAGHEVRLATWTLDPVGTKFPFLVFRSPGIWNLMKLHSWAELIFENNPSLRLSWPNALFMRPHVIAVRTWISRADGTSGIQDKLKRHWLKQADKVIAVSEAIRSRCFPRAVVIGNPYRVKQFKILPGVNRSRDFVFLGRMVSDKGVDLAIQAVHYLNKKTFKKYTLSVIGDGPERGVLKDLVRNLEMEEYVTFTGALRGEKLSRFLNKHLYILIPSRWEEPFGNVALEGMACGCIPVVSDGGGLPDAVGNAGLTFERGNLNSMIDAIERVLNNPGLAENLRNNAWHHLNRHHPETISRQYLEEIGKALFFYKKQVI